MATKRQQRAIRAIEKQFAAWQKKHLKHCNDLPDGECECSEEHELNDLELVEMLNGDIYAICINKVVANWRALGYLHDPIYTSNWHYTHKDKNGQRYSTGAARGCRGHRAPKRIQTT